jgi:hypothetical protein
MVSRTAVKISILILFPIMPFQALAAQVVRNPPVPASGTQSVKKDDTYRSHDGSLPVKLFESLKSVCISQDALTSATWSRANECSFLAPRLSQGTTYQIISDRASRARRRRIAIQQSKCQPDILLEPLHPGCEVVDDLARDPAYQPPHQQAWWR